MNKIKYERDGKGYRVLEDYRYYSKRYNRYKTVKEGMYSDGATSFIDLGTNTFVSKIFNWVKCKIHHVATKSTAEWFFVHDALCYEPWWDCGLKISNWDASTVAGDILWESGYRLLSVPVWFATFLFGGQDIKKENGWFRVTK